MSRLPLIGDNGTKNGDVRRRATACNPKKTPKWAWRAGYGPLISSKQLDFVLCHPETTEIVMAIELDDPTHGLDDRRERDVFLDNAMEAAGVPLLRVETADSYDTAVLTEAVESAIDARAGLVV